MIVMSSVAIRREIDLPKSQILGHRIWWEMDWNRAIQASIRLGFTLGLFTQVLVGQFSRNGFFSDAYNQIAGFATVWAMMPSCMAWSRGIFTHREQGPDLDFEEVEHA